MGILAVGAIIITILIEVIAISIVTIVCITMFNIDIWLSILIGMTVVAVLGSLYAILFSSE